MKSKYQMHQLKLPLRQLRTGLCGAMLMSAALIAIPSAQAQQTAPAPVEENSIPQDQEAAPSAQQSAAISQKQALDLARARFAGNVISINEVRTRNAPMRYRIRMDNEGNIFTVFVDSRNGAITRD